ncbi:Hypothetical predicted protein [Paramuricea clavata]|uniref:Uncharacterized protein n=1 Tax=Paramuricea clavata TaxID=317549 RepID=A0A7D9KVI6_PARCT|nr:Hypothetical predicted protein [Paramuricea clavata]
MLKKNENLTKQITELSAEVAKANERNQKMESELSETAKRCADFQKKCAGFFNQVVSLNSKQQESEEEISSFKRACENLRAQVAEKEAMMVMMRDSLKTYEDDFRRENEEKAGIQKRMETAQQESERLRRENQSHMATIRHFESEIERMSKLLNDEKNRHKTTSGFQTGFGQPFGSSASRSFFHERTSQPIVVADGAGGVNESSTSNRQGSQAKSSPTLIECPYCSRSYPYHLIEGHVQDCMEDSLYMDD